MTVRNNNIGTALVLSLLLTACGVTPITKVETLDAAFSDKAATERLGIIKFDVYVLQPPGTGQAVAGQFGLLGVLAWAAATDAANQRDYSVDAPGVKIYRDALSLLVDRLRSNEAINYVAPTAVLDPDDVELSRHIRHLQLHGTKTPSAEEIAQFCDQHALHFALYSGHWGGVYRGDNTLIMASKWHVYDRGGTKVVSVITRSRSAEPVTQPEDPYAHTDALFTLYQENVGKFLTALKTGGP